MDFTFWQPSQSSHQSSFLRELANIHSGQVKLVVLPRCGHADLSQNQTPTDFGRVQIIYDPTNVSIRALATDKSTESIHIFSGIVSHAALRFAYKVAVQEICTIGFMTERPNNSGLCLNLLKEIRNRFVVRHTKQTLAFYLAIGTLTADWAIKVGYSPSIVYPFAYFVENPTVISQVNLQAAISAGTGPFKIVFIGKDFYHKGLDILLQSLAPLTDDYDWELHIVGNAKLDTEFRQLCDVLKIANRTKFHGVLQNQKTRSLLNQMDLLVLPSRYDGWGAVVNEALMQGVPVVCSDQCGAIDLLGEPWRGDIFPSNSIPALSNIFEARLRNGKPTLQERLKIAEWAKRISGESGARYFLEVIEHATKQTRQRPQPPWLV